MPTPADIEYELEQVWQRIEAGEVQLNRTGLFNVHTDYQLKAGARLFDANLRNRRLAAMQASLASGDTPFVDAAVQQYVDERKLNVTKGSPAWSDLAFQILRAEIEALKQTVRRDVGDYSSQPLDPILKSPKVTTPPVPLKQLFHDYIATRQAIGKHRDGGANWEFQIESLIKFLGHSDARKITKRSLLDWRDSLMATGKSAKTVSDKSLAAIKAVLRWAFENDRLPTNEGETVRQEVPKKVRTRETGYQRLKRLKFSKLQFTICQRSWRTHHTGKVLIPLLQNVGFPCSAHSLALA